MGLKLEDFEVISIIGKGSCGTVKKIRRKCDGQFFVWKEIHYASMSESEKQGLVLEVNLLRLLRHPNIVRFFNHLVEKKTGVLYIIMEYCSGGDLSVLVDTCKRTNSYLEEILIWKILKQVCEALRVCHEGYENQIVLHRDIKTANVFLDKDGNVKLGDFGLARTLASNASFAQTFVGTPYYMSPEVIEGREYNCKSDIWSLGCLIYELSTLEPPFQATNQNELARQIKLGRCSRIPSHYSDDLWEVIKLMLKQDDFLRPIPLMILQHPRFCREVLEIFNNDQLSKSVEKVDDSEPESLATKPTTTEESLYNISWTFGTGLANNSASDTSDNASSSELWQTLIRVPPKVRSEMSEEERQVEESVMREVESLIKRKSNEGEKMKCKSDINCNSASSAAVSCSGNYKSSNSSILETDSSHNIGSLAKKFENLQCNRNLDGEVSLSDLMVSCGSDLSDAKSFNPLLCVCGGISSEQWRQRLCSMRSAEISVKERELRVEARERDLNKREKRVQALEEDARQHLIRAQIYLKQSRIKEKVDISPFTFNRNRERFDVDTSTLSGYAGTEIITTSAPLITESGENPFLRMRQQILEDNNRNTHLKRDVKSNTLDKPKVRRKTADIIYVDKENCEMAGKRKSDIINNVTSLNVLSGNILPSKTQTSSSIKKQKQNNIVLNEETVANKENILRRAFSFNKKKRSVDKENLPQRNVSEMKELKPILRLGNQIKNEDINKKLKFRQDKDKGNVINKRFYNIV